jgi:polyisoprenoid-binding protein YceI
MAVHAGRHKLGPDRGRIVLHTFRDGLAATAGHDLTIEATRWSGELGVNDDLSPDGLDVHVDLNALTVRDGTGGIKPLTDRDRREIAVTMRKVLAADRYPEAAFTAGTFTPTAGGGRAAAEPSPGAGEGASGEISGTLTLRGAARPLRMQVTETGPGRYHVAATVVQSDYGIKPYTAFLGALRVRDAVDVTIDVDLSDAANGAGT